MEPQQLQRFFSYGMIGVEGKKLHIFLSDMSWTVLFLSHFYNLMLHEIYISIVFRLLPFILPKKLEYFSYFVVVDLQVFRKSCYLALTRFVVDAVLF